PVLPTEDSTPPNGRRPLPLSHVRRNEMSASTPPKIFSKEVAQNRPPRLPRQQPPPLPGGQARRNKLLVSWGAPVIAARSTSSVISGLVKNILANVPTVRQHTPLKARGFARAIFRAYRGRLAAASHEEEIHAVVGDELGGGDAENDDLVGGAGGDDGALGT